MQRGDSVLCVALFALMLFPLTNSFKEQEFKKCHDASFCQRNRHVTEGRRYELVSKSLSQTATHLTARLKNVEDDKEFFLEIVSVDGPSIRFRLKEDTPIHRYEVKDILVNDPLPLGPSWSSKSDSESLQLDFADGRFLKIQFTPFKLFAGRHGKSQILINGNGMMHMEPMGAEKDKEFEETFKSFTDSNPKGPQAISLDLTYLDVQHVFGIPEHSSHLSLPVTYVNDEAVAEPYRLYNLDVFEYDLHSNFGLYGSIPFLLGQNPSHSVGAFWLNSAEMYIDLWKDVKGTHSQWIAESGVLDLFLMLGPTPKETLKQYTSLTGTTAMPQFFALGYHQCRWNYKDEADVRLVDATFDENRLPYDVLWLDIEHTDSKKYLTWDSVAFSNPIAMQNDLASKGRKMVVIVDPHIKVDRDYPIYIEAKKKGYFVQNKNGGDFEGHCWPGTSSYLDVTRTEVRSWWAEQFQLEKYKGSTKHLYVWNDMNEPSVFNGPEITMQKDLLHNADIEHRDVHNLYGFYYHMATHQGLAQRGKNVFGADGDRPFVLSRSFFAGSQRLGAIWTGDNESKWSHMKVSIPMLLNHNLAGMAFCGADVGGFFGDPDAELITRWYQLGAFYPFFRAHAHIESRRREPYLFGNETTNRIRTALRERYALLPYIYTQFRKSHLTGEPIMRPLWYEFPEQKFFEVEDQFMFGPALMIRPVLDSEASSVQTIFPSSIWYDAWTGVQMKIDGKNTRLAIPVDLERIPFYYRGGSILFRKERPRRSTVAMARDPITIVVALDENGRAEGDIYMDDGYSLAYERAVYIYRRLSYENQTLHSFKLDQEGSFEANVSIEKIVILGLPAPMEAFSKQTMTRLETLMGPLRQETGAPKTSLVIKKPDLSIDEDWSILFSVPKQ